MKHVKDFADCSTRPTFRNPLHVTYANLAVWVLGEGGDRCGEDGSADVEGDHLAAHRDWQGCTFEFEIRNRKNSLCFPSLIIRFPRFRYRFYFCRVTCLVWSRGWLLIRHLRSLNGLKFALFYHLEYIWRSFFKTRNSRTLKIHVVFLCTFQFSGVRFTFRIANVSFFVTFIHCNLLSIRISYTRILSNKKVH